MKMSKDTHDIPITLALPRYEVMNIMYALRELSSRRYEQALDSGKDYYRDEADDLYALTNKIFATTREQFVAFENQTK